MTVGVRGLKALGTAIWVFDCRVRRLALLRKVGAHQVDSC
jgi:hypothetical protein